MCWLQRALPGRGAEPGCTRPTNCLQSDISREPALIETISPPLPVLQKMPHADSAMIPPGLDKAAFWDHVHEQLSHLLADQRDWVCLRMCILGPRPSEFR